jgi:hypothetical protein
MGAVAQVEAARGGIRVQIGARIGSYLGAIAGLGLPLLALLFMTECRLTQWSLLIFLALPSPRHQSATAWHGLL